MQQQLKSEVIVVPIYQKNFYGAIIQSGRKINCPEHDKS